MNSLPSKPPSLGMLTTSLVTLSRLWGEGKRTQSLPASRNGALRVASVLPLGFLYLLQDWRCPVWKRSWKADFLQAVQDTLA